MFLEPFEMFVPLCVLVPWQLEIEFLELKHCTSVVLWRTTSIQLIDLQQQFGQRLLFDVLVMVCLLFLFTAGNKDYKKWKAKSGCTKLGRDFNGFFHYKVSSNLVSTRTIYF